MKFMMKNIRISFMALITIVLFFQSSFAQKCGVLLGLRTDEVLTEPLPYGETSDASRCSKYRTLWIFCNEKDSLSILEMNELIVPRKDGFWKVMVMRQNDGNWSEDFILSTPLNQQPEIPVFDSTMMQQCEGNKRLSLIFIGTDYLSYEGGSDGYCAGAAHPWHVHYLKTVSLEAPSSDGVDISVVLGREAQSAMLQSAKKYLARANDERLNPQPDERNWGLIRRRGQWVLRGLLDYSSEVYRGHFAHFNISLLPTTNLVGYDRLSIPWRKIKALVPTARDAISSPNKNLLIILTTDKLFIYSIRSDSKLKFIQKLTLYPNEFMIMAQWAVDRYVDRWNEIIF